MIMFEGFTDWYGGKNPVPGKYVRVIYRGSSAPARRIYEADKLDWSAMSSGPQIVAYYVMTDGSNDSRSSLQ